MSGQQTSEIELVNEIPAQKKFASSAAVKFLVRGAHILFLTVAGLVTLAWAFFLLWLLHLFAMWLTT
jgi:hypothetical protein